MNNLTAYNLGKLSVLIVDDDTHMRYLVRQLLGAFGIRKTQEAEEGAMALEYLNSFHADLVICDWNMLPLDGLEFTRIVRASDNPFLPIIMLTAYTEMHRVQEARDAGVDEFLSKPISATTLYSRIVSVIEKRRPFVHSHIYRGPDRRRRRMNDAYIGPERRIEVAMDELPPNNVFSEARVTSHLP